MTGSMYGMSITVIIHIVTSKTNNYEWAIMEAGTLNKYATLFEWTNVQI